MINPKTGGLVSTPAGNALDYPIPVACGWLQVSGV